MSRPRPTAFAALVAWVLCAGLLARSAPAAADDGGAATLQGEAIPAGSPYADRGESELRVIELALDELGLEAEHEPWGRQVCAVHLRAFPIVFEEDVLPLWVNLFHRVTRERVIARANTIAVGDTFDVRAYEDAERAIRDPYVFSVVAVVPAVSAEEGCVEVVVTTRDIWSLKAGWAIETNGRAVTSLYLAGTENNVFGSADAASMSLTRTLGSWRVGPTYISRHLFGSRLTFYEQFAAVIDREAGGLEGTANTFQLARPLYATDVEWAWALTVAHDFSLQRRYTGTELDRYRVGTESVPERYRSRYAGGSFRVTRSWGTSLKTDLSPGVLATWRDARPEPYDEPVSEAALQAYARDRLPRSELAIGPTLGVESYRNEYFRLVDYQSFGVSEELREGHTASVGLRLSEPAFGSDVRYVQVDTGLSWRVPVGSDAFVGAGFEHSFRADGGFSDVSISGSVRVVGPRSLAGRLVGRVTATELKRNGGNLLLSVGGDTGLRGYPNGYLKGTRAMQANLEWRSRPLRIASSRLGGVAFYDVGAAWDGNDIVTYYPSVGVGLRLVVPSIGTIVRAGDIALPLRPLGPPVVSIGLDHAF